MANDAWKMKNELRQITLPFLFRSFSYVIFYLTCAPCPPTCGMKGEAHRARDRADLPDCRAGSVRDRLGRRQLPECLHLPHSLREERDLAGLAVSEVPARDRRARQHPD